MRKQRKRHERRRASNGGCDANLAGTVRAVSEPFAELLSVDGRYRPRQLRFGGAPLIEPWRGNNTVGVAGV